MDLTINSSKSIGVNVVGSRPTTLTQASAPAYIGNIPAPAVSNDVTTYVQQAISSALESLDGGSY